MASTSLEAPSSRGLGPRRDPLRALNPRRPRTRPTKYLKWLWGLWEVGKLKWTRPDSQDCSLTTAISLLNRRLETSSPSGVFPVSSQSQSPVWQNRICHCCYDLVSQCQPPPSSPHSAKGIGLTWPLTVIPVCFVNICPVPKPTTVCFFSYEVRIRTNHPGRWGCLCM